MEGRWGVEGVPGVERRNRGVLRDTGPRGAGGEERMGMGEELKASDISARSKSSNSRGEEDSLRRFDRGSSSIWYSLSESSDISCVP